LAVIGGKLDRIVFSFTEANGFSIFARICLNLSESEEIHTWIKRMDGVSDVRVDIMQGNIPVDNWLDEDIKKQLSELAVG
jgi:hypothetical protein